MINRLHGKVEGHELDDRAQAAHRCAGADPGKAVFGDRGIDHPLWAELIEQTLGYLIGALILGHFLAHHEHARIAPHFLGHRIAQGFAHSRGFHVGASRDGGIELALGRCGTSGGFNLGRDCDHGRSDLGSCGFPFPAHHRNHRTHLHTLGSFGNQDLTDDALIDSFEFHRRLVSLDLGEDIAGFDCVALLDQPLGQRPFLHRRRKRRHFEFNAHQ